MANTYTRIIVHLIFACKGHQSYIPKQYLSTIHSYMSGIIRNMGCHPIIINGPSDHVHILMDLSPKQPLAQIVKEVKVSTNQYINSHYFSPFKFEWQTGYACFSANASNYNNIVEYIRNQEEHHSGVSLEQETRAYLAKAGVEYDERYIFRDE